MPDAYQDFLKANPLKAPKLARGSFRAPDIAGGQWAVVELPGWTGWELGVYVDASGELAGFKINPTGAHGTKHIAATPDGGLTTQLLRSVRLSELDRTARSLLATERRLAAAEVIFDGEPDEETGRIVYDADGSGREAVQRYLDQARTVDVEIRRTGRRGTPDITYARIAARYVDKLTSEARPIEALANDLSISVSQARTQVFKAREKGFLTSRGQGKAGGVLTPRAIELLTEEQQ